MMNTMSAREALDHAIGVLTSLPARQGNIECLTTLMMIRDQRGLLSTGDTPSLPEHDTLPETIDVWVFG